MKMMKVVQPKIINFDYTDELLRISQKVKENPHLCHICGDQVSLKNQNYCFDCGPKPLKRETSKDYSMYYTEDYISPILYKFNGQTKSNL